MRTIAPCPGASSSIEPTSPPLKRSAKFFTTVAFSLKYCRTARSDARCGR